MKPFEMMASSFAETHPEGAARALERLDSNDASRVLLSLPSTLVGPVAEKLTPHAACAILSCLSAEQIRNLLEQHSRQVDDEKAQDPTVAPGSLQWLCPKCHQGHLQVVYTLAPTRLDGG